MPGPEASRPGDPRSDVEKKRSEYVGRLRAHKSNLEDFRKTGVYPTGGTIENDFEDFQSLHSELFDFHLDHPDQAESLMRSWDVLKQRFQELMEKKGKSSPEAGKELSPKGRNSFERYLLSEGFPKESLNKYDAETLSHMRSFVLSKVLEKVVNTVDWTVLKVRKINDFPYTDDVVGPTKMSSVILSCSSSIEDVGESSARRNLGSEIARDFNVIDTIFALGNELKSAHGKVRKQQILSEVENIYASDTMKAMLDPAYFTKVYGSFPPLLNAEGNQEKVSLGDAFFQAYKEIKRAGKKWVKDPKTGWLRPELVRTQPLPPFERNRALFIEDDPHHTISLSIENITKELMEKSMAPEQEAGEHKELKPNAISRLVALASKSEPEAYDRLIDISAEELANDEKHPSTTQGKAAALLAYHWALILMDLDEMDNVGGRPVGQNVLSRVIHASTYANKTMEVDSQESKTNPFIVGRALSFVRPFGKFAVMDDGKTFEQAVMNSGSWKDLQNERWPEGMTQAWVDSVLQGLGEYERAEKGLGAGKLFSIAKFNWEEKRVIIDTKIVDAIHDMVRYAFKYHVERDMVPGAVQKNADAFVKAYDSYLEDGSLNPEYENRRPPSEEFTVFTVLTANAKIDPKTGRFIPDESLIRKGISAKKQEEMNVRRVLTRFPKHYYVNGRRLGRWIDDSTTAGKALRFKGFDISEREVQKRVAGTTPGAFTLEPSGQIEKEMILRLNDGIFLEDKAKGIDNTPKMLLKRLIVEYCLEMIASPGDTMAHLTKEDYLPLGMFFSPEIRKNYKLGGYGKISEEFLGKMEQKVTQMMNKEHDLEFFRREDPGIIGDNVFTEKLYFELLQRMGHRLTANDWKKPIVNLFGGTAGGGVHGKH